LTVGVLERTLCLRFIPSEVSAVSTYSTSNISHEDLESTLACLQSTYARLNAGAFLCGFIACLAFVGGLGAVCALGATHASEWWCLLIAPCPIVFARLWAWCDWYAAQREGVGREMVHIEHLLAYYRAHPSDEPPLG
jgi:hypothetical protein